MPRFLARLLPPVLAAAACLAPTAVALALLPATRPESTDDPAGVAEPARAYTFAEKLGVIGRRTWERVLRPRRPSQDAGYRNWVQTVQRATPLLLAGLAVAVAFRANVLNIGAQGQYVAGAIAGTTVALHGPAAGGVAVAAHLLAAMAAGAALAAVAAGLERWRGVPVVLSTLLLNFVALEVLRYLLQGPMRARAEGGGLSEPQSEPLPAAARLPEFFGGGAEQGFGDGVHLGFFLAVAAAVAVGFVLRQTAFGFRLRVVGQNPDAARFAGIGVGRVTAGALALSGALAGLAGGVQVAGVPSYILFPDLGTDGVGFSAIAVALLGRLSAVGVVFSALFFGLVGSTFQALETSDLEIHSSTAQAVQGGLVLALLVATHPRGVGRLLGRWVGRRGAGGRCGRPGG